MANIISQKARAFGLILALSLLIILPNLQYISAPFWHHHEFNGVFYSQIAKNYLRYGLLETKGGQVTSSQYQMPDDRGYHTHHPATYPLLLALSFKIFGISETVARSLSIASTILGFCLLALLVKNKWAILPVLFTPLVLYYNRLPVFEPLLLPATALFLLAYKNKNYTLLLASSLFLIILDWPGYWPPFIVMLFELFAKNKDKKIITSTFFALAAGTALILMHQFVVTGSFLKDLLTIGDFRLNVEPYNYSQWVKLLISRTHAFLGIPVILTALFGLLVAVKNKKEGKLAAIALLFGITHIFIFRNITWYHDYMLYHTIPFLVLATDLFLTFISEKFSKRQLLIPALSLLLTISTILTTQKFYKALTGLEPQRKCAYEKNQKNAEDCIPYLNFYNDTLEK